MVETEAAQRGVIDAIRSLDVNGEFTVILSTLSTSVFPKYLAVDACSLGNHEDAMSPPSRTGGTIGSYRQLSREHQYRQTQFENALQEWARQFRLTRHLTDVGECLPWILDFGRRRCAGTPEPFRPKAHRGGQMHPPGACFLEEPHRTEKFSDWAHRIRPVLKVWYSAAGERQRPRHQRDSSKRNPDHYKWFVLHICGGLPPKAIADRCCLQRTDDAIRKGIDAVCAALRLTRK